MPAAIAGSHSDRARPALVALTTQDPALGALALWCLHRDAGDGPAARTEGGIILYGPAFAALPLHEQIGLAAHHVLHVALRHGPRMGAMAARLGPAFDDALYGLAADALVNEALLVAGHALPRPAVRLTEVLTEVLGLPPPADALADWDVDRLYLRLAVGGTDAGKASDGGKATQGSTPQDRAQAYAARAGFAPDLVRDVPDEANPEGAEQAALWRQHLTRALEAGRLAGRGLGVLGHRIADIPQPRTPWELVLRRLMTRALLPGAAQTWHRPARDWIASEALARARGDPAPAFRPATTRRVNAPRVALAVDASGSVEAALLARFMAEVGGIARRVAAEVTLIAFDDAVRWQVRLDPWHGAAQIAGVTWPRGGGTDFGPPIRAAQAMGASVVVVLTDLDGPCGAAPRSLPVIWAVPEDRPPAPFGHVLSLAR